MRTRIFARQEKIPIPSIRPGYSCYLYGRTCVRTHRSFTYIYTHVYTLVYTRRRVPLARNTHPWITRARMLTHGAIGSFRYGIPLIRSRTKNPPVIIPPRLTTTPDTYVPLSCARSFQLVLCVTPDEKKLDPVKKETESSLFLPPPSEACAI